MHTSTTAGLIAAGALLCAGCVSMGTNYDPSAVTQLQPGMSREQVITMLGKPNSVATMADGRQQMVWTHATGTMFGANARSVALLFGPDGKLIQTVGQAQTATR